MAEHADIAGHTVGQQTRQQISETHEQTRGGADAADGKTGRILKYSLIGDLAAIKENAVQILGIWSCG